MPKLDKVEVYGYNEPARAIGGDYYDLIKLSDNTLIGFIADVSWEGNSSKTSCKYGKNNF